MATKRKKTSEKPEAEPAEVEKTETAAEATEEAEQTAPQDKDKEKAAPKQERDEFAGIPNPCVYCGPSVRGVARQYTTYQGGIPEELKEFIRMHPLARRLIVHPGKFAAVRRKMETPGTAEAIIYKKLKSEL